MRHTKAYLKGAVAKVLALPEIAGALQQAVQKSDSVKALGSLSLPNAVQLRLWALFHLHSVLLRG